MALKKTVVELEPMNPDTEAVYDAEVSPLVAKIVAICRANRIPCVLCFQLTDGAENDAGDPMLCTTRIPFAGLSPTLNTAGRMLGPEGGI